MRPASPDPRSDAAAAIEAVLAPLREEADRVDRELRDNRDFLEERRRTRVDPEMRAALDHAADSPQAPESLRRMARRIAAGELTWDDVFARRAGRDGAAFLDDAFRTAREHFIDASLPAARVPEAALETGIDPDDLAADIARTRAEAQAEHDAVFRRVVHDRTPTDRA